MKENSSIYVAPAMTITEIESEGVLAASIGDLENTEWE